MNTTTGRVNAQPDPSFPTFDLNVDFEDSFPTFDLNDELDDSFPTFDLNDPDLEIRIETNTLSSLLMNQGQNTAVPRTTSWGNMDILLDADLCADESKLSESNVQKKSARRVSLSHVEQATDTMAMVSPTKKLTKQVSAFNLSTPTKGLKHCLSHGKGASKTLANSSEQSMSSSKTMLDYYKDAIGKMSPSVEKCNHRSPRRRASDRTMSSSKFFNSNAVDGGGLTKARPTMIPKVTSVQALLSEFDKIMDLPGNESMTITTADYDDDTTHEYF